MFSTLKKLILVSRPISWPNTAYPFAVGYLIAGGHIGWFWLVATVYFLLPYNLLMYGVNDIFDYESDIRNPRKGGIEGMREQRALHPAIAWTSMLLNAAFLPYLLAIGTFRANTALIVIVFFVIAYSVKGLRLKERPGIDSITSSIHFVGPLVYAVFAADTWPKGWQYIVAFFLWGMASHAFGAVQDIKPDKAAGIGSIATVFGASRTVRLAMALYSAASLLLLFRGLGQAAIGIIGFAYVANICAYRNVTEASAASTNKGWRRFIWLNFITGFVISIVLILMNATI